MQEVENELKNNGSDKKVYELGYLLVSTIGQEDVPVNYGNLKELVSSFGGEIIADEVPKMINLAYSMRKVISNVRHKFNTAYFGWTKFFMVPGQALELKKHLDLDQNFIRFLILKTVKENTIAAKRFVRSEGYRRVPTVKRPMESGAVTPIDKEEIDKEIDALVAV
ncbi:hypothetical protein A3A05_00865 [Candidatus Nomurabacteria bacterium RIFCSPLOWO2_01_FULL_41_12]|uniref:Small ribosomal subunit protein bS6 n=1 Tax=Candidatus Nomurabacteria bacterium RIFCSPLOWO2_01_FULL_41_12 TaxID=1801774 RepID=A0A1F6WVW9_9BACT|nr:MAG: hypothetical protein A2732_01320 [Candidatus Nomurabacteria bacterium RIFCSPHIGHO2_01_FULL_40_10]OGI86027.1 MAG: hypothetical protein A3A05_00865 [Candidatus Nomurabacteria bacterium RIFCSPLOWO2_01_FULL_41_12]